MSFLHGAYVTLANLKDKDLARILSLRLSPLYVSVHSTDEKTRCGLMGILKPTGILGLLKRLAGARIQIHAQIVVVPGYNDGLGLEKTVQDLARLHPQVASIALVPVGLTRHRRGLRALRLSTPKEARELLGRLKGWQERFLAFKGTRLVFAADEWYLRALEPPPDFEAYEDFPQAANGVGLIAAFKNEWASVPRWKGTSRFRDATLVTGKAFGPVLKRLARGMNLEVIEVPNRFYGGTVTVAGLLAGQDILAALKSSRARGPVIVPDVMLRDGGSVFLDDMSLEELQKKSGRKIIRKGSRAKDLAGFLSSREAKK